MITSKKRSRPTWRYSMTKLSFEFQSSLSHLVSLMFEDRPTFELYTCTVHNTVLPLCIPKPSSAIVWTHKDLTHKPAYTPDTDMSPSPSKINECIDYVSKPNAGTQFKRHQLCTCLQSAKRAVSIASSCVS